MKRGTGKKIILLAVLLAGCIMGALSLLGVSAFGAIAG